MRLLQSFYSNNIERSRIINNIEEDVSGILPFKERLDGKGFWADESEEQNYYIENCLIDPTYSYII